MSQERKTYLAPGLQLHNKIIAPTIGFSNDERVPAGCRHLREGQQYVFLEEEQYSLSENLGRKACEM